MLEKWDESFSLYGSLQDSVVAAQKKEIKAKVFGLIMLATEKNREIVEDTLAEFRETVSRADPRLMVDGSVAEAFK